MYPSPTQFGRGRSAHSYKYNLLLLTAKSVYYSIYPRGWVGWAKLISSWIMEDSRSCLDATFVFCWILYVFIIPPKDEKKHRIMKVYLANADFLVNIIRVCNRKKKKPWWYLTYFLVASFYGLLLGSSQLISWRKSVVMVRSWHMTTAGWVCQWEQQRTGHHQPPMLSWVLGPVVLWQNIVGRAYTEMKIISP